jgi:ATP-dependent Clp endopeptidase proteolytic subunit ClpP
MGALPVHHTATVDTPWDKSSVKAEGEAALRYCYAWVDGTADADLVGSYKFPHATDKGAPANLAACRNGLARLDSADIPDGDRSGVKSHLQAHLDDGKSDLATGLVGGIDRRLTALANLSGDERVARHLPRAHRLSNRDDWFRITDYTDGTPARLDVYDEIGFWGVSAADFNAQLQAVQAPSIEVHINSPGGDVFDGLAICNLLRAHPKPVDVVVDGLAASAASYIAMAGDTVTVMPNSQMMIHDASGLCIGNATDMALMAELLDRMSANIAGIYATKTGKPADDWRAAMKAETWYDADEAVEAGLADRVGELARGQAPAAVNKAWNLSFYAYSGREQAPTPVLPVTSPAPAAPATTPPVAVAVVEPEPVAPNIDPEKLRAAFSAAFRQSNQVKEARQ